MLELFPPINLNRWISEHREALRPPVCNKMVFEDQGFIIMVVGGPNVRRDFHVNHGPEFFYQLQGDMVLRVVIDGRIEDIRIGEGEMFQLPGDVPHSPQRFADTIGLVIERHRLETEQDTLSWYCEKCVKPVYEEKFALRNVVTDLPPIFARFEQNPDNHVCRHCGERCYHADD